MVIKMRGKKIDNEFISDFISKCVQSGIDTPDAIVQSAHDNIVNIDKAIKRMEEQKIIRSKLLDVIETFDKSKTSKSSEAKVLSFFKIQHPHICQSICQRLKIGPANIEEVTGKYVVADVIFCVKQLIEHKVISKSGSVLLRGDSFDEYMKFALKESL